jgi:lipid-A-disaccharide synthase
MLSETERDRDLLAPHPALRRADLAICYAGTSTLESTLSGVPVVTISPLSRLSAYVARRVIKLDHCALPNLILARRAFPELPPWESDAVMLSALLREVMSQAELADGLMNLYHQDIEDVRTKLKSLQSEQVARRLAHAISIRGV